MAYNITKIINNSSKSVILTNPMAERDTHLVTKNSSLRLKNPPLVPRINAANISYRSAVLIALNIYTMKNNWCVWDDGTAALVGLDEDGKRGDFPTRSVDKLELIVDENGTPSIRWYQLSLADFKMQQGAASNWCWAAVTASVVNYYNPKANRKPCEMANLAFSRNDCCNSPKSSSCNKGLAFDKAMYLMPNWREIKNLLQFGDIIKEIDDGRPIPVNLYAEPVGHMIVITGYNNSDPDKPKIEIHDPNYTYNPKSVCDFNTFPASYSWFPNSSWNFSCLTKPNLGKSETNGALASSSVEGEI